MTKQIKLIDFGEASFSDELRQKLHTPMLLQPPESVFNERVGLPADIWVLACTIFDAFGNGSLFEAFMPSEYSVLSEMDSALGILPERWRKQWERRSQRFQGKCVQIAGINFPRDPKPLALRVKRMRLGYNQQTEDVAEQLSAEDSANLEKLLASMLKYEPSERVTAEEIAKLEWIQHPSRAL